MPTAGYAYRYASLEKDTEDTTEQRKAEIGNDETKVTEQAAEEKTKAGEQETEDGSDSEDNSTEELTIEHSRC